MAARVAHNHEGSGSKPLIGRLGLSLKYFKRVNTFSLKISFYLRE